KFANGNNVVKETVEKGSEWYKNWLDSQNNIFTTAKEKATNMTSNGQDNMSKMNEFYQGWFNTQMNWAKQMWEMNMNHMKNSTQANTSANPMDMWNNWATNWNTWTNNMNQAAQWNDMMNK